MTKILKEAFNPNHSDKETVTVQDLAVEVVQDDGHGLNKKMDEAANSP